MYRIAFKFDPRIKAHNVMLEKEKEQVKKERYERKQKAKEESKKLENAVNPSDLHILGKPKDTR